MKSFSIIILFVFAAASIRAQNFQISFTGSGSSTTVDNVIIENLTKGTTTTVTGTDVLQLTSTTGINELNNSSARQVSIYPNPMTRECNIAFKTNISCKTTIRLFDIGGKLVVQSENQLPAGNHIYKLTGLKSGLYLLKVSSDSFVYSSRLIGNSISAGVVDLSYISSTSLSDSHVKDSDIIESKNTRKGQTTVDFQYNTGDILLLTATSGNYKTVAVIDSPVTGVFTFAFTPCIDAEGTRYSVVFLGSQAWMAENLRTTKYNNGDLIATTPTPGFNITSVATPKYQWAYAGTESNVAVYGRLYTWFTVTDSRLLCPTGWHVPADADWTTLTDYVGGLNVAGGKLKEIGTTHWENPNIGATNKSGFTALPGGYRHQDGTFSLMGSSGYFWTSETGSTATYGISRYIQSGSPAVTRYTIQTKHLGLSVRCVKD